LIFADVFKDPQPDVVFDKLFNEAYRIDNMLRSVKPQSLSLNNPPNSIQYSDIPTYFKTFI